MMQTASSEQPHCRVCFIHRIVIHVWRFVRQIRRVQGSSFCNWEEGETREKSVAPGVLRYAAAYHSAPGTGDERAV